jgi:predicted outer membrane repeat protein
MPTSRILRSAILAAGIPAALTLFTQAAILTVNTTADQLDIPAGAEISLREAQRDAAEGDTIVFDPTLAGQTLTLTTGVEIVLSKSVTIDATSLAPTGLTLDGGSGDNRIFYVQPNKTVSLAGLTFSGGNANASSSGAGYGGAINTQGNLTLSTCSFTGNAASVRGGAIYSNSGTLKVDRCTFWGNTCSGRGGAIHAEFVSLDVSQSTLTGNTATDGGGIFFTGFTNGQPIFVAHCTIANNTATTGLGGGIYGTSNQQLVYNSVIAENAAPFGNPDIAGLSNIAGVFQGGGALLAPLGHYGGPTQTRPPLTGSPAINGNYYSRPDLTPPTTDQRGYPVDGSPDLGAAEGKVVVTTAVDETDPLATLGAGISIREALRDTPSGAAVGFAPALSGQTITLTTGTELFVLKSVTIDATTLPGGLTFDGGPSINRLVYIFPGQTASLLGLTLTGGNGAGFGAAFDGGAIYNDGTLNLNGCTLYGNTANSLRGGAIFNNGALTMTGSTLSANTAALGGAVFSLSATLAVNGGTFSGNSAQVGGAIHGSSGAMTIDASTFISNSAGLGGAIHHPTGSLTVNASTFSANSAIQDGGAIHTSAASLTISRSRFTTNSANAGGAIQGGSGAVGITQTSLTGNSAGQHGGAIQGGSGTLTLSQSTLSGNTAIQRGGAIHSPSAAAAINRCTLTQNSANEGGAMYGGTTPTTINRSTITGNSATSGGGGVYFASGSFSLTNSILTSNTGPAGTENSLGTITLSGANLTSGDPQLNPLGNFGSLTQTMPPLAGSPAVNATVGSTFSTDQRGFPSSGKADLGAAEGTTVINTLADESDTDTASGGGVSLREAIRDTPAGAAIVFSPSLSGQTITLTSAAEIVITRNLVIDASALAAGLTIDGGTGENRIFSLNEGQSLSLIGLTLTGGNGVGASESFFGGAISSAGFLTLTRCTISSNTAAFGAIFSSSGTLALQECTVSGNNAQFGGGVYCIAVEPTITQCTFSANSAQRGAAIYSTGSTLTVQNSLFSGNSVTDLGGAIFIISSTATLEGCALSGNSALRGGAVFNSSGSNLTVQRSTFAGNTASTNGGAIAGSSPMQIQQCTLSGNSAPSGGAIQITASATTLLQSTVSKNSATIEGGGVRVTGGSFTLTNSILAGNTAGSAGTENFSGTINASGPNLTSGDPKLAQLGSYGGPTQTMPPAPDSPAVDAGSPTTFTTDQRGLARVLGATVDLGASESGHPLLPLLVNTAADENDGTGTNGISLREAVAFAPAGSTIAFAPALSGQTITLTTGAEIVLTRNVTIDATSLPEALVLHGGTSSNRLFSVSTGQTVSLLGLTLSGGNGTGADSSGDGAAIFNRGTLTLTRCTLSGNSSGSDRGGAVFNAGSLTLQQCTLSGNAAPVGGAIASESGSVVILHSTLSANTATDDGGGIAITGGTCTLTYSIVAGNLSNNGATSNISGSITTTGANLTGGNPQLATLGNYGGPMRTMPPLPASPAIDAAVGSGITKDQRGLAVLNTPDLGAAEGTTVVSTLADELDSASTAGTGVSLREAIRDTPAGSFVVFDSEFSGDTISLDRGSEILMSKNVTIDASTLPGGINIVSGGGGGVSRIFRTGAGQSIFLSHLSLFAGSGIGPDGPAGGGAIYNEGNLSLTRCLISGNSVPEGTSGGAILSTGTLTALKSSISSNTASLGGAIFATGPVTLDQCDVVWNFAAIDGGAIHSTGPLTLKRSTFTSNQAANGGAIHHGSATLEIERCTLSGNTAEFSGGGVYSSFSDFTLRHSILAGNSAGEPGGENASGGFTATGANVTSGDPLLGPIGTYGGDTRTMVLLPGSPALNAAVGNTLTSDQRGFPIIGTPDIGAYEAGTFVDYDAWVLESTGTSIPFFTDSDGDGMGAGLEYAIRGDLVQNDQPLTPTLTPVSGGHAFRFRYRAAARDVFYIVQRSPDLGQTGRWLDVYAFDSKSGVGGGAPGVTGVVDPVSETITVTDSVTGPKFFWRLYPFPN